MERQTLAISEACLLLGISRTHGYMLAKRGEFPVRVIRAGERYLVPRREIERLLDLDHPRPDDHVHAPAA